MNNIFFNCVLDGKYFTSEKELATHLRKNHKLTLEKYAVTYLNKKSFASGEPIPYRSFEQYVSSFFLDKKELTDYLNNEEINIEIRRTRALICFSCYTAIKKLIKAPTMIELASIDSLPNVECVEKLFNGSYGAFCRSIGLQVPFYYKGLNEIEIYPLKLQIDTREQKPLEFDFQHKERVKKLDFGDYSTYDDIKNKLYFERKSLPDLLGTLSKGYGRFKNEIKRAKQQGASLVIVVEDNLYRSLQFNKLRYIHLQASPAFIFHRLRELMREFDNIQFVFTGNREGSTKLIEKCLCGGNDVFKYDLQYFSKQLCG